ncbi:hypothetical protein [uncultured Desulfovibrio sp.]|uniref:hypothetical protein n=1 Tax=uncultured Desulfovibrio sp. TaxID=167968 RepID=UPI002623835F|nr:hypothetical protein [uncultured Desulfovibrio sp.]
MIKVALFFEDCPPPPALTMREGAGNLFFADAFLARFAFEKGETRGGGTAPSGPK